MVTKEKFIQEILKEKEKERKIKKEQEEVFKFIVKYNHINLSYYDKATN